MWRRTRTPDGVRLELEGVELADAAPADPGGPPTDAGLITALQRHIGEQNQLITDQRRVITGQTQTIADLRAQLGQPAPPVATPGALTDPQAVQQLLGQLDGRNRKIARLEARLAEFGDLPPAEPRLLGGPDCSGCEQLHKVIAEYEAEHARDRAIIARLELATDKGRTRTLGRPMTPMPDGERP